MLKGLGKKIVDGLISIPNPTFNRYLLRTANYVVEGIRARPTTYAHEIRERMRPENFLPLIKTEESPYEVGMDELLQHDGRVRIRIVYPSGTAWNCIGSLYDELIKDNRYQTYVLTERYQSYISVMNEHSCRFIGLDEYDLKRDCPDVLILTSYSYTSEVLSFTGARQYAGKIISLFPNIVVNESDEKIHWRYVSNAYQNLEPDYYLFDNLPYNSSHRFLPAEKCINMGNPQIDEIYARLEKSDIAKPFDKLSGKFVFLWATDHGVQEYCNNPAFVSDLYLRDFFSFFSEHQELGLIIRPHPYLIRELTQDGGFWTYNDYLHVKEYCANSANIVWDDTSDYCSAYIASDAMLIDVNCGMTISYLCTGKPILRLVRSDFPDTDLIHPELRDSYYYARSFEECKSFIDDCLAGADSKRESRAEAFRMAIKDYDGKNGQRIKAFIDEMSL